ncbi:hypothetical protein ABBQ38_015176 [Trebouxia sp. C0009 RCD-2024]
MTDQRCNAKIWAEEEGAQPELVDIYHQVEKYGPPMQQTFNFTPWGIADWGHLSVLMLYSIPPDWLQESEDGSAVLSAIVLSCSETNPLLFVCC